ncbi:hypothetical protein CORC01_01327, partial [Colletotrichum orchidophilum]
RLPDTFVTWKQAAQAGATRLTDARKENPDFVLGAAGVAATVEQMSGLLTALGGSAEDGRARRVWINAAGKEINVGALGGRRARWCLRLRHLARWQGLSESMHLTVFDGKRFSMENLGRSTYQ